MFRSVRAGVVAAAIFALCPETATATPITIEYLGEAHAIAGGSPFGGMWESFIGPSLFVDFTVIVDPDQPNQLSPSLREAYETRYGLAPGSIGWYSDPFTLTIGDWKWAGKLYQEVNFDLASTHVNFEVYWRAFPLPLAQDQPCFNGDVFAMTSHSPSPAGIGPGSGVKDITPPGSYNFTLRDCETSTLTHPYESWVMTTNPVPEPASVVLFGTGLIALWARRRGGGPL